MQPAVNSLVVCYWQNIEEFQWLVWSKTRSKDPEITGRLATIMGHYCNTF